ncbi:MAG: hypothetical protein QW331_03775 [Candidatus Woesearchaeota archaeon]
MALFGLFKKKKEETLEIPPPPPIGELPSIEELEEFEKPIEVKASEKKPKNVEVSLIKEELPEIPELPELPELPETEELELEVPEFPQESREKEVETYEERTYEIEKRKLHRVDVSKPLYIGVMDYKAIVDDLAQIRVSLKEADDVLFRLEEFKEEEEKEYKRWQSSLIDIQRKLIYADKSLFAKR